MGEITDALLRSRRGGDAVGERARVDPPPPARDGDRGEATPHIEIPRGAGAPWVGRAVILPEQQLVAESFRNFALQTRRLIERLRNRAILVTSALRIEGKTTTSSNLALALASLAGERRVALVDLDLRRPCIARSLGVSARVGIERVLAGDSRLAAACLRTDLPALDLFLVGRPDARAHELLAGQRLAEVIAELCASYDAVVVDGPPVLLVPDPLLIAPHVGGAISVARSGFTVRSAFREMLHRLPRELLIGSFLNDAPLSRHVRKYSYYYHSSDEDEARK